MIKQLITGIFFVFTVSNLNAQGCCGGMGGINYCDSSAGRYVCKNGDFSACYCTRHAVMDLQLLYGCCLWKGGVSSANQGIIVCNDGTVSEMCSLQTPKESVAVW